AVAAGDRQIGVGGAQIAETGGEAGEFAAPQGAGVPGDHGGHVDAEQPGHAVEVFAVVVDADDHRVLVRGRRGERRCSTGNIGGRGRSGGGIGNGRVPAVLVRGGGRRGGEIAQQLTGRAADPVGGGGGVHGHQNGFGGGQDVLDAGDAGAAQGGRDRGGRARPAGLDQPRAIARGQEAGISGHPWPPARSRARARSPPRRTEAP